MKTPKPMQSRSTPHPSTISFWPMKCKYLYQCTLQRKPVNDKHGSQIATTRKNNMKNNKKRVTKWIVPFIVRHDAEWKKWRRIFTGLACIWRNARARQIQKANPKGMHLSYNNIDRYIFDQKDNNIEDYRDVASFSTSCRPAQTSLQQSIIHCQR